MTIVTFVSPFIPKEVPSMPQTYVLTLKIAVPMPDPVDHPQEMEETAAFIRAAKKGDWPGNLPPGAVVESVRVNGPINRRIFL